MLQLWLYFIFSQQYHIAFQHKPALALKSTPVTSAALLWCWGISRHSPFPSRGWLQCRWSRKCICFRFPTLQQPIAPSCSHLAWRKKTTWCANFLLSASGVTLVLSTSALSALLDLSFPMPCLSLPMEKSKLGQVLTFFLVGHRKEIKAQVKSLPHRTLFTFPIVSYMLVPRLWEHSFAFQNRLKNLGATAETNWNLNKVH